MPSPVVVVAAAGHLSHLTPGGSRGYQPLLVRTFRSIAMLAFDTHTHTHAQAARLWNRPGVVEAQYARDSLGRRHHPFLGGVVSKKKKKRHIQERTERPKR